MVAEVVAAPVSQACGVVRVTLRHTARLNAMSRAMWRQLREVFQSIEHNPAVRCVIIEGEGSAFCSGGDISEYPDFRFDAAALRDFHEHDVWSGLAAMLECDVPIVAHITGPCMGAGLEVASCCDVRIAGTSARFGVPIAKLGFPMAPREANLVVHAVGDTTARSMLLEATIFSAQDMLQRGFLTRVVDDFHSANEALASACRIAALAPGAARANKRMLREIKMPVALDIYGNVAIKNVEKWDPYAYADHPEHREGIHAFLQKRPAAF